ncbi:conjugative transfer region protein TrbK [Rhodopseudomonas rhenobacensis]|uniref:Conjugative transfer region protein TrbK n=1 Tax=Rhodopseudomonas rhenobacensis TaxID=87461 RepID=A0A7W7Z1E7_9BRAD|nr:putative entry exclusion protein TrbK-alt [Rhodopseudomonas rhenobacensis]MBB5046124.1 conjugative transfer region protein TrbK [Rhodopseudomonas rhenobacensis]
MLGRSEIFRAAAIVALVAVFIATLVAVNRRPSAPAVETPPIINPASDDLSAELRRCSALGPQDAEDPHCGAVWEKNRQRFFGRPARPLPPQTPPGTAAPATPSKGDAR